jgi:hypothetical protein
MLAEPRCFTRQCKHFIGARWIDEDEEASEVPVCPAFPNGIPEDIAYGDTLHNEIDARQVGDLVYVKT